MLSLNHSNKLKKLSVILHNNLFFYLKFNNNVLLNFVFKKSFLKVLNNFLVFKKVYSNYILITNSYYVFLFYSRIVNYTGLLKNLRKFNY